LSDKINTHGLICDFGKHKGTPWTQVPVSYLNWIVNEQDHSRKTIAEAELKRRGTVVPDIDISGHAIDRVSQQCLSIWEETRINDEGLHAWLVRMASEARSLGNVDAKHSFYYQDMKFVFEEGNVYPVLKTVMRKKWRPEMSTESEVKSEDKEAVDGE